jgi:tRNA-splicing ligase RtcB (3'-phosphate/5'-hydroxy nucleic acid ligase)
VSRKDRKKRERKQRRASNKAAERGPKIKVDLQPGPYAGRKVPLERIDDCRWRVPKVGAMHVEGVVYADRELMPELREDKCLEQVANVATLPGIVGQSMAMPDIHWGYGFPIGGVAAFDPDKGGIVSPGGVGFDINCGVRLLGSDLSLGDVRGKLEVLTQRLFEAIPAGVGSSRKDLKLSDTDFDGLLADGVSWAVDRGLATDEDRDRIEENGRLQADPAQVSDRARKRGRNQVGTLGSGNHFAEIGYIDEVYDEETAKAFGLREGQVTLMIHSGSRGLGHQVCTDFVRDMLQASAKYGIPLVDRQLCCAPIGSPEADRYLGAMAAAANFAFVNRQVMTHWAREVFQDEGGSGLRTVYDVCHNIAKFEEHEVDGVSKRLLVHRKGATRALPKDHRLLPDSYRAVGQPVIIPGDMGRYSYVLKGAPRSSETFGSACHGAGRLLSRSEAKRRYGRDDVADALKKQGVIVIGASRSTIVEEIPQAYKDVKDVVGVVHAAGLAEKVVRIRPLGCVKG